MSALRLSGVVGRHPREISSADNLSQLNPGILGRLIRDVFDYGSFG